MNGTNGLTTSLANGQLNGSQLNGGHSNLQARRGRLPSNLSKVPNKGNSNNEKHFNENSHDNEDAEGEIRFLIDKLGSNGNLNGQLLAGLNNGAFPVNLNNNSDFQMDHLNISSMNLNNMNGNQMSFCSNLYADQIDQEKPTNGDFFDQSTGQINASPSDAPSQPTGKGKSKLTNKSKAS